MSNVLKVSLQTTIHSLADLGWSQRRIASELGINRETVGRYLRLAKSANSISCEFGNHFAWLSRRYFAPLPPNKFGFFYSRA